MAVRALAPGDYDMRWREFVTLVEEVAPRSEIDDDAGVLSAVVTMEEEDRGLAELTGGPRTFVVTGFGDLGDGVRIKFERRVA